MADTIDLTGGDTESRLVIEHGQLIRESANNPVSRTGEVLEEGLPQPHLHELIVHERMRHSDSTGEYHLVTCLDVACSYRALGVQTGWAGL